MVVNADREGVRVKEERWRLRWGLKTLQRPQVKRSLRATAESTRE
jgi:hypothetical protein